jgi:hypothetical protein
VTGLNLVFLLFLLAFFLLAGIGFTLVLLSSQKDRAAKREKYLRFYPDENGNYEQAILNDGTFTQFQSGNARWYAPQNYIIQPLKSEIISALPKRPELTLSVNGSTYEDEVEAEVPLTYEELSTYLIEAKKGGQSMTKSFAAIGVRSGPPFQKLAKLWKQLP